MCEFCGTKNEAVVIPEEVPQSEEVLFVGCAPGPAANADAKGGLVVFCVDTSGSMGVTTEVRINAIICCGIAPTLNLLIWKAL